MMKNKKIIIFILLFTVCFVIGFLVSKFINTNSYKLKQEISSIKSSEIEINKVIPFEWDKLYIFTPYTSKEGIEKQIGFKSNKIKDNMVNEGILNFVFTKDKTVVLSESSYPDYLGYNIDINGKKFIERQNNHRFEVIKKGKVIKLKLKDIK